MAKDTVFTITGVDEITKAFNVLPKSVAKKVVRKSVREALRPMMAAVKSLTPRKTGALAKSTKIRAIPKRRRGSIAIEVLQSEGKLKAKGKGKGKGKGTASKGAVFYGAFVNLGTRRIVARAFMERAFDQTKDQVASDVAQMISEGIAREAATLGIEIK